MLMHLDVSSAFLLLQFIAAGLSHCQVDERNLKLAFDRLDSDHKGYITFENVMDLMGNDATQSEDAMRRMWGDSMKACQNKDAHITYDDFLLLMKGQTRPGAAPPPGANISISHTFGLFAGNLPHEKRCDSKRLAQSHHFASTNNVHMLFASLLLKM